jgi:polyvinyl alcohol dehydrogenase (cytochrome)
MALDLETGRKTWVKQLLANDAWVLGCERVSNPVANCPKPPGPDHDFAQSPILRDLPDGRSLLAIGQKSGVGWGLDPDKQGEIVWQHEVGLGSIRGGMVFGSAADERQVYFATSDIPHGPTRAGGLAAVNLATGERAWFVRPPALTCENPTNARCTQGQSAAVTAIPGVVFSGATNGIIRAYSTVDGRIIWEYDTVREYQTINRLKARGGYIDGPGPTVVNGVLYMNSGYQTNRGGMPGNVLLAFTPGQIQ